MSELPDEAYAASLAALDRMTGRRLAVLLGGRRAVDAYRMVTGELAPEGLVARLFDVAGLIATWREGVARWSPARIWQRCADSHIAVVVRGSGSYPEILTNDPAPAAVLFVRGSFTRVTGRRVGVVGTRNATAAGRGAAFDLGRDLAAEGVHVVSGLARGIDGSAHRGALGVSGAAPVAVVASGLDVVYPPEHRRLWDAVAECGVLVSEAAPWVPPEPYRFPLRNRIIAGLSEVLVVVESRSRGGSLITVEEARRRAITVMAVPGSLRNPAAAGTNDLVRDGCPIVTDARDVMIALNLDTSRTGAVAYDARPRPAGIDSEVLQLCGQARTLDHLALLTGLELTACAMAVARLELVGWLQQANGWFERVPAHDAAT